MKILMTASEARPLCKTGGLADVIYSLSKELVKEKHEVSIILPFYQQIKDQFHLELTQIDSVVVKMSWRREIANIYKTNIEGINYYLIEDRHYFERDRLYGENDDNERFAFLCLAIKEFLIKQKMEFDIIHVNDWHTAMIPCLFKEDEQNYQLINRPKFVLSIHNPAFQGMMDKYCLGDYYNLPDYLYENGQVRFKNTFSTLKAGIVYADKIIVVSPSHRQELLTSEGGMGLEDVLKYRSNDFYGILNGIDYEEWNPSKDKAIPYNFNGVTYFKNKKLNKIELLKRFNLEDNGRPVFAMVSRITWQKGMELVFPCCYLLASKGCNIIILGSGEYAYEQEMENLRRTFPNNVGIYVGYNDELAHLIYAGSDIFLMPSLFEPCGLGQMIAERYATLPLVRRTGGLKDSVICFDGLNPLKANGFGFDAYNVEAINNTALWAIENWDNIPLRKLLMKNAYMTDNSWKKSAKEYIKIYRDLID